MRSMRPIVGITAGAEEKVTYGAWEEPAVLTPLTYVHAIERVGGRAIVLPPSEGSPAEVLEIVDGIVFSGGADVDPETYGAEAHPATNGVQPERDSFELELLRAALDGEMPLLAVCRGSQVLNVALGGDLVQHLPEVVGHDDHKHTPGVFGDHDVTLDADSSVGRLLGHRARVKSHHHQGYGRMGEGLRAVAWAEDGTVEALEDPARAFAVGVLWHPEEGEDLALFAGLVEEARRCRGRRRPPDR
jgi:gamma-glutamyl-gamma-aminobutyrate hydrolase PuuD